MIDKNQSPARERKVGGELGYGKPRSLPYFLLFYLGIWILDYHVQFLDFTNKWSVLRVDLFWRYAFVVQVFVYTEEIEGFDCFFVYTFLFFWLIYHELESKIYTGKTRYTLKHEIILRHYIFIPKFPILSTNHPNLPICSLDPVDQFPYPILVPVTDSLALIQGSVRMSKRIQLLRKQRQILPLTILPPKPTKNNNLNSCIALLYFQNVLRTAYIFDQI